MSYTFTCNVEGKIAVVLLQGDKTLTAAVEIWDKLHKLIEENRYERILVLDEMQTRLSAAHVLRVGSLLEKNSFPWHERVAIVDANKKEHDNDNAFGETAIFNRGWRNIRVFETKDKALAWLEEP